MKADTLCSRGGAGTSTHHGDAHPAQAAETAFPIAPNPTPPGAPPAGFTPGVGVLSPDTPAQQSSRILQGIFQVYRILHSPSSPQSLSQLTTDQSSPKPQGSLLVYYRSSLYIFLPAVKKNYLLIHGHRDPFPPVSRSASKRPFCTKRLLRAASCSPRSYAGL